MGTGGLTATRVEVRAVDCTAPRSAVCVSTGKDVCAVCPSDGMYLQGSVAVDKQGQFHLSIFISANVC